MVRRGFHGVARLGVAWRRPVRYSVVKRGMGFAVECGVAWRGEIRLGMARVSRYG